MNALNYGPEEHEWPAANGDFAYLSRVEMNPISQCPITSLALDPLEDLIWCGNLNGRVASFVNGNIMEKYTGFAATNGDVREILVTEHAVFSLGAKNLKASTRQGLVIFNHSSHNVVNLCAMLRMPMAPATIVCGGDQQKLIQYDFEKQKELRVASISEKDCTHIKTNCNSIFTSDSEGNIAMRASNTLQVVKMLSKVHGGPIADFDICDNKLITCGCSYRINALHGDPFVKIYDLRNFQALKPLPFAFAPVFARFVPTYFGSRIIVVSQLGQAQIMDINDRGMGTPMIVESEGYALTAFAISNNKQLLTFGDEIGNLHFYADRPNPNVNDRCYPTEFADPPLGTPQSFPIDDLQASLASVPLPFSQDDSYLSDWPAELCIPKYWPKKAAVLYPTVKTIQFVGYAPNPNANTPFSQFNIVPYDLDWDKTDESEPEEEAPVVIPQFYRKLRKYGKNKRTKSDAPLAAILKLNKSNIVPIEYTSTASCVNSIAQIINAASKLRNVFLSHICDCEHCFACQLGFLFRMMAERSQQGTCASTNLIRSMVATGHPTFPEDPIQATQLALKYVSQYMDLALSKENEQAELRNLLEIDLTLSSRCIRCGECRAGLEKKSLLTLNYNSAAGHLTMCGLIEKALHLRSQKTDQCEACSVTTRHEETRKVKRLPPILLIDANPSAENYLQFWTDQLKISERRPRYKRPDQECCLVTGGKNERLCRFGAECWHRDTCKYSHGHGDWEAEVDTWLSDTGGPWRHFIPAAFSAKVSNGIAILSENVNDSDYEIYELVAFVTGIRNADEDQDSHIVTFLREKFESSLPWSIVNDILVTQVHQNEALHMDSRWKLPIAMMYVCKNNGILEAPETRASIPAEVFETDNNLTGNEEIARERRGLDLPNAGEIVGIDAEFINVRKGHSKKSVGRVSCLDSNETVIIDDYVVTCDGYVVDDYLTPYSGIMEDDLDPLKSTKHLTTLKRVYMKILHLVEKGVIFVGHALNNDFSVLNIFVPREQIIDTVHLFHIPQQRMISLQFLAWHLLGEKIQVSVHDSVEDARIALKLYKKYLELIADGTLETVVHKLYDIGNQCNWRTTDSPSKSASPSIEAANDNETAGL